MKSEDFAITICIMAITWALSVLFVVYNVTWAAGGCV